VINYVDTPDWGTRVRELTDGQGADVIVEVGGAATIAQSIAAAAYRGIISLTGARGGTEAVAACAVDREARHVRAG
jgi:NADPH:quinone reductase-like Zn-dependent oxidoreductase